MKSKQKLLYYYRLQHGNQTYKKMRRNLEDADGKMLEAMIQSISVNLKQVNKTTAIVLLLIKSHMFISYKQHF